MSINNNQYYDSIASKYERIMDGYAENKSTRKAVKKKFTALVDKGSNILDFGGGTGLDLDWLAKSHTVTFWEPSDKMREIAKKRIKSNNYTNITCIDKDTDNLMALLEKPDFTMFDAVLGNFAVINSIKDLTNLASELNQVTSGKSDLFFLVLFCFPETRISTIKKMYSSLRFNFSLYSKKFKISNNNIPHYIYLHTAKHIRKSFSPNFKLVSVSQINNSSFKLVHLRKHNI